MAFLSLFNYSSMSIIVFFCHSLLLLDPYETQNHLPHRGLRTQHNIPPPTGSNERGYSTGGAPAGWILPPWTDGSAHHLAASRRTPR